MGEQGRFWLYDTCDGSEEFLGRFDTMEEVQRFCREQDVATDGEFWPVLKEVRMMSEVHYGIASRDWRLCVIYNWTY